MIVRLAPVPRAVLYLSVLGIAACSPSSKQNAGENQTAGIGTATASVAANEAVTAEAAPSTVQDATAPKSGPRSCADEIGAAAAEQRAKICRTVSPATHPPCNVANSCAMIEDEIARSCALLDGKGAPMPGCQPAPKSMEAAADVVKRYYSALNAGDYDTAWQQWGDNGPPNQTRAKFGAGFAQTRETHVTIGALQPGDGGAGSIYQPIPVTIDATLDDGTHQRFGGDYVVRRVNDVDGASADQLRWHIDSAHLKPLPAP